jgi:hypothetical protein
MFTFFLTSVTLNSISSSPTSGNGDTTTNGFVINGTVTVMGPDMFG